MGLKFGGLIGFVKKKIKKNFQNDIMILLSEFYFLLLSIYAYYVIFCSILLGYYIKTLKKLFY